MRHILMIEDDVTLQNVYKEAFTAEKFTLTTVASGKEGLEKAKAVPMPDIIVLDVMLPGGLNGFDVLDQLKKDPKTAHIPVLILTNLDSEQESADAMGASGYIIKSNTSISDVVTKINTLLGL